MTRIMFCLFITLTSTMVFAAPVTALPVPKPTPTATPVPPKFCVMIDKSNNFARCETVEIVCYRFGKLEQCYPKPAPKVETKK